jgi:hypothetical protein
MILLSIVEALNLEMMSLDAVAAQLSKTSGLVLFGGAMIAGHAKRKHNPAKSVEPDVINDPPGRTAAAPFALSSLEALRQNVQYAPDDSQAPVLRRFHALKNYVQ